MTRLLKRVLMALESEQPPVGVAEVTPAPVLTPAAPSEPNTDVVMRGPLSVIYARALNLKYAKIDPVLGTPGETEATTQLQNVESVGVESQFNDLYAQAAQRANSQEDEPVVDDTIIVRYPFGTHVADKVEPTPVEVMGELATTGVPHEFIFANTQTDPTDDTPVGGAGTTMLAIESVQIVVRVRKVQSTQ